MIKHFMLEERYSLKIFCQTMHSAATPGRRPKDTGGAAVACVTPRSCTEAGHVA